MPQQESGLYCEYFLAHRSSDPKAIGDDHVFSFMGKAIMCDMNGATGRCACQYGNNSQEHASYNGNDFMATGEIGQTKEGTPLLLGENRTFGMCLSDGLKNRLESPAVESVESGLAAAV